MHLTPAVRDAFNNSMEIARTFGQSSVGTEHLLLAILQEQESAAAGLVAGMGFDLPQLRVAVRALAGQPPESPTAEE